MTILKIVVTILIKMKDVQVENKTNNVIEVTVNDMIDSGVGI